MFYLLDFNPILPDVGLLVWSSLTFVLFWLIVGRFAFKPIAGALHKRESDIQGALDEAKRAREEMAALQADNDRILAEAREERSRILKESKETGDRMIAESKEKAKVEAQKIVENARLEIENQSKKALDELKGEVGNIAVDIAEKVLRKQFGQDASQKAYIDELVSEIKLN